MSRKIRKANFEEWNQIIEQLDWMENELHTIINNNIDMLPIYTASKGLKTVMGIRSLKNSINAEKNKRFEKEV